jgi:hypothetical protein
MSSVEFHNAPGRVTFRKICRLLQVCLVLQVIRNLILHPTARYLVGALSFSLFLKIGPIRLIARVIGVGIETADMLVHEVLLRKLRDRRAVARYAGLTGAPDESGSKRREKGLAKAGNARVRGGMIQLAWRFLLFQKDSALAQWYRTRTEGGRNRKTIIVALARKLLIALWRLVTTGEVPAGVVLRAA